MASKAIKGLRAGWQTVSQRKGACQVRRAPGVACTKFGRGRAIPAAVLRRSRLTRHGGSARSAGRKWLRLIQRIQRKSKRTRKSNPWLEVASVKALDARRDRWISDRDRRRC